MPPKTKTMVLADTLERLKKEDFERFCYQLLDRREAPRVRRIRVEDKSRLQVTDVLVSTFTESGAVEVALEILGQIGCSDEADALDSNIKACMDKGDPTFRKTSTGELERQPSQEARNKAADRLPSARHGGPPGTVKKPKEVEAEAKACVVSEGGDPCNDRLVLSRYFIQFGKYKGQTFKWLLENDVRYTAYLVASHQEEQKCMSQDPLTANKDSLTRYATAYPEVKEEVRLECAYHRSLQSGQEGKALLGFGAHYSETLQDLYESEDREKLSYVNFLRTKRSTCDPGSKMETAIKYILKRDNEQAAAATNRPTTRFNPLAGRPTRSKRFQRTRGQPTSTSRPVYRGRMKTAGGGRRSHWRGSNRFFPQYQ